MASHEQRSRLDAVHHEGAEQYRRHHVGRNPQRQERNHGARGGGIVRRFRTRDPFDRPVSESFGMFGQSTLYPVGNERRNNRPHSRQYAQKEPEQAPACDGGGGLTPVVLVR